MTLSNHDRGLLGTLYGVICFTGVVGNTIVLCAVLCKRKNRKNKANKYLISLAVSDLFTSLLCCPYYLHNLFVYKYFDQPSIGTGSSCHVILVITYLLGTASILSLTLLSIDRCVAIKLPFWYERNMTEARFTILVAWIWFQALITIMPSAFMKGWIGFNSNTSTCNMNWHVAGMPFSVTFIIINFIIPAILIAVTNMMVFMAARRQIRVIYPVNFSTFRRNGLKPESLTLTSYSNRALSSEPLKRRGLNRTKIKEIQLNKETTVTQLTIESLDQEIRKVPGSFLFPFSSKITEDVSVTTLKDKRNKNDNKFPKSQSKCEEETNINKNGKQIRTMKQPKLIHPMLLRRRPKSLTQRTKLKNPTIPGQACCSIDFSSEIDEIEAISKPDHRQNEICYYTFTKKEVLEPKKMQKPRQEFRASARPELKVALATLLLTIGFWIAWLPFIFPRFLTVLKVRIPNKVTEYTTVCALINSAWNPLIVLITRSELRKDFTLTMFSLVERINDYTGWFS